MPKGRQIPKPPERVSDVNVNKLVTMELGSIIESIENIVKGYRNTVQTTIHKADRKVDGIEIKINFNLR
jgi:transposase-like protein